MTKCQVLKTFLMSADILSAWKRSEMGVTYIKCHSMFYYDDEEFMMKFKTECRI